MRNESTKMKMRMTCVALVAWAHVLFRIRDYFNIDKYCAGRRATCLPGCVCVRPACATRMTLELG